METIMKSLVYSVAILALPLLGGCQRAEVEAPVNTDPPQASAPVEQAAWSELLPNATQPLADVVGGGQPTAEQLAAAAAAGYKTVINLRMPGEHDADDEAAQIAGLGMEYVALPIPGADGITEENARELARLLGEAERPAILHCGSGNRVGALLALSAFHVDGKTADEAIQYGLDSGMTRLESTVREHFQALEE